MQAKQPPATPRREPVGNLCVIRDENLSHWDVIICPGLVGERKPLARFSTRGEAEAFANQRLAELNSKEGHKYVLHVDDCPCWQKEL